MLKVLRENSIIAPNYSAQLEAEFSSLGGSGKQVIGVFSGGGGLDLGFAAAGFDIVMSSDVVPEYCSTLSNNLPKHAAELIDISKFDFGLAKEKIGRGGLSGIIGGPPCQSFSILGDRGSVDDPRGALVFNYISMIKKLQPDFFLFENVPGLRTINGGKDWHDIQAAFSKKTGYRLFSGSLNSVKFGVPQKRERLFVIGFRDKSLNFEWPIPTHGTGDLFGGLLPEVTVADAFANLRGTLNNEKREHGPRVSLRYSKIAPGERDRVDHTDRIELYKPSGVVLVGSGGGGGRPFIHPTQHRHITVREAARLQSFPDWWVFSGGTTKQYRQVGNAVPPLLVKAIARSIKKALR